MCVKELAPGPGAWRFREACGTLPGASGTHPDSTSQGAQSPAPPAGPTPRLTQALTHCLRQLGPVLRLPLPPPLLPLPLPLSCSTPALPLPPLPRRCRRRYSRARACCILQNFRRPRLLPVGPAVPKCFESQGLL